MDGEEGNKCSMGIPFTARRVVDGELGKIGRSTSHIDKAYQTSASEE